jgi:hypothetical protein
MSETHYHRMNRMLYEQETNRKCRSNDLTFGNRCLNCGYTPEDHKVTLFSPRLDLVPVKQ